MADPVVGVINIYYRTSKNDDYTLLSSEEVTITDDLQQVVINVGSSIIPRKHHYQLKIEAETSEEFIPVLYGLERKYRVIGRSR